MQGRKKQAQKKPKDFKQDQALLNVSVTRCQFIPNPEKLHALEREYPDFRSYYFEAVQALFQLSNGIEKMGELYHAKNGFSRSRYLTLMVLFHQSDKRMTPNEIANRLNVTRGNMTGLIDSLQKEGYVRKYQDEEDRRQVWIELTAKGEGYLRKIFPDYFRRLARMMSEVSRAEIEQFIQSARKIYSLIPRFWDE